VKKPRFKSAALASAHSSALDLHNHGFIDAREMKEYDALCIAVPDEYPPSEIQKLRKRNHISQAVLASVFNLSLSTVRQWEIGAKKPSGASLKLLDLLDRKGLDALL